MRGIVILHVTHKGKPHGGAVGKIYYRLYNLGTIYVHPKFNQSIQCIILSAKVVEPLTDWRTILAAQQKI